jgi:hypothetical protein
MLAVNAFDPKEATVFARKMLEEESRGNGDQMNAYERVAKRCGVTARQLRRFLSGEIKKPAWDFVQGIRLGWVGLMEEKIKRMQHDLEIQKRKFGSDHFEDLDAQAQALAQEIRARKEKLTS